MRKTLLFMPLVILLQNNNLYADNKNTELYIMFKDHKVTEIRNASSYAQDDVVCVKSDGGGKYTHCLKKVEQLCGIGVFGRPNGYDEEFCNSPFTEMKDLKSETLSRVYTGVLTLGVLPALGGTMHTRIINQNLIDEYLEDTNIKDFEPIIKSGKNAMVLRDFDLGDYMSGKQLKLSSQFLSILEDIVIFDEKSEKWLYADKDQSPNQLVAEWVKQLMKPRQPSPISVPAYVSEPFIPPVVSLTKDEFETKAQFKARVDQAIKEREKTILENKLLYAKELVERNKEVNRLHEVYKKEIEAINKEQEAKLKTLDPIITHYSKLAFALTRQQPLLSDPNYDAETGMMEVNASLKPSYENKMIAFKQNPSDAKNFKNNMHEVKTQLIYDIEDTTFMLKKITAAYDGENYLYEAAVTDFPSQKVSPEFNAGEGFKIVLTPEQEATMFAIQTNIYEQKKVAVAASIKKKISTKKKK